jgi:hypothetical protein
MTHNLPNKSIFYDFMQDYRDSCQFILIEFLMKYLSDGNVDQYNRLLSQGYWIGDEVGGCWDFGCDTLFLTAHDMYQMLFYEFTIEECEEWLSWYDKCVESGESSQITPYQWIFQKRKKLQSQT